MEKKYKHKYYDKNDKEIKDKKKIEKAIKGVYIAPAYDNVKINLDKEDKILAIGYDEKGRSQYVYNKNTHKLKAIRSLIRCYLLEKTLTK